MAEAMVKMPFQTKFLLTRMWVTPGLQDGFATAVMHEIGGYERHEPKSFGDLDSDFMIW